MLGYPEESVIVIKIWLLLMCNSELGSGLSSVPAEI